jgi:cytoskeletal protein RodZ
VGAFGEKLRKQREQRGITLDAISNTTKISPRMLRALEDEQFDQLPGGVFNKGFVRAYARQTGLDEEETVSDYLAALRESQVQAQQILPDFRAQGTKAAPVTPAVLRNHGTNRSEPAGEVLSADNGSANARHDLRPADRRKGDRRKHFAEPPPAIYKDAESDDDNDDYNDKDKRQDFSPIPSFITLAENSTASGDATSTSSRLPRNLLAAAFVVIVVGFVVWNSHRHGEAASRPEISSAQSAPAVPAHRSANVLPQVAAAMPNPEPVAPEATAPKRLAGAGISSDAAFTAHAPASVKSLEPKPAASLTPVKPLVAKSITAEPVKAASSLTVLIRAEKTTWVAITADGKPVAHETLIAPAHTSVRAVREIVVRAGNAAGVSFLLNGKEIPAAGEDGEVRTYIFDGTGVRTVSQAQLPATAR